MPRSIDLSQQEMARALLKTGGHVAGAAKWLGISVKTLRRRIAADPTLMPKPEKDPFWSSLNLRRASRTFGTTEAGDNDSIIVLGINEVCELIADTAKRGCPVEYRRKRRRGE